MWKEVVTDNIIKVNMDWEPKETMFSILKVSKTPTDFINIIKDKYWSDSEGIEVLVTNIKKVFNHK